MKKIFKAFLSLIVLSSLLLGAALVKAEESEYKDYYESKSQTVNGDFEAFEVGTTLSETQLEGAWGTVGFDNPAVISEVDGSHVLDVRGGAKKYSSAFLMLPDTLEVGTILRVTYDIKLVLTEDKTTYEYLDVSFVGGSNTEYYIVNLKQMNLNDVSSHVTSGAEVEHYPINVTSVNNGWAHIVYDVVITRNDLIQTNSMRWLAIFKSEDDHMYIDNVNLYYLQAEPYVEKVDVKTITITDGQQLDMKVGDSKKLSYTIDPENATDKEVTFSSSDVTVATVDKDGKVTAIKAGSSVVTVKSANGVKAQIAIIVSEESETPTTPDTPSTPDKTGCKGEIVSSIIGLSIVLGSISILSIKKRKEEK